ncbi:4-alpha-glucanotransferase [Geosporobacter subterraneus DSM 17957]|uniref:4-alpha-glucanotransferase n=1 Tax=Geosporobacter subterraneus DSM 17957 TaxID=1121919 RepID=A0A1M6JBT3_9FIRM|nr:4-alpha-glucanotransferase [Geosporobacter subterraneus]SHJ44097.1 4-alpha-glucanotransferase [Geosporobacter subterraneus DSM 17957]
MKRSSGILMHITSLPSPYGIGTLGKDAYEFVDFLERAGQKFWQLLPLGPTSYGDSPYQSFSSFAGNPYLIDLDLLVQEGLLQKEDFQFIHFGEDLEKVDYEKIYFRKLPILKKAYEKGKEILDDEMDAFRQGQGNWVEDYALYMAVKNHFKMKPWKDWGDEIKKRDEKALDHYRRLLKEEINYWVFLQYIFFKQWTALKAYANKKGIRVIGDIPIYVAEDSADAWANSEILYLDEEKNPISVAGCPPDFFSETGQLWGNPIYRWDVLEKRNYDWWIERIRENLKLYDVIRIDHFRGFESYWEIPYGSKTAAPGRWVKGPAMKLFDAVKAQLGNVDIIAEDLGFLTDEVLQFRVDSGYPGMKVLQFAFDTREESDYLPHNYDKNCVVYTGTHDNDTIIGWMETASKADVAYAVDYLHLTAAEGYHWGFIRGAWSSVGQLAIAPMQDFLGLGSQHRMNIPSTVGGNWLWRAKKEAFTEELADKIYQLTKRYGR